MTFFQYTGKNMIWNLRWMISCLSRQLHSDFSVIRPGDFPLITAFHRPRPSILAPKNNKFTICHSVTRISVRYSCCCCWWWWAALVTKQRASLTVTAIKPSTWTNVKYKEAFKLDNPDRYGSQKKPRVHENFKIKKIIQNIRKNGVSDS